MNLNYSHNANYFLFAQLLIRHLENYVKKQPNTSSATFDLRNIYDIFQHDLASTTTNLDAILNIADEYTVETLNGDQKIIRSYKINAEQNNLSIEFNPEALDALHQGKSIIEPDATSYQ